MANSPSQIQISHVIFDFDGILVDTKRLYTVANERSLEKFGGKFTIELKAMMMGRKKEEAVKILIEAAGLTGKITCEEYMMEYDKNIEEITTQQTEALPGADKLLGHFFDNKIPLAICTGSDHLEFKYKTAKFPHWVQMIPEQLRLLCGSDPDVKEGKPSPQPYQIVLQRFKVTYSSAPDPAQVLVFEDSINGVKSAVAAGCTVIMVPQPDQLPKDWREHLPKDPNLVAILDSLHHFKPEEFGLPSFGNDEENGKMMNWDRLALWW